MSAGEGAGRGTELEQIQARSRAVTNKTVDVTRNLLALTEESKEAGIQCLVALDEQGEQLDNIDKGLNDIHYDVNQAKRSFKKMGKCCGLFTLPWKRGPSLRKANDDVWKGKKDGKVVNSQPARLMTDNRNGFEPITGTGHIARITNDAIEDEMGECMVQVDTNIGNLRNMALDIGSELENQNNQLNQMENKADSNVEELKRANETALQFIKN